MNDMSIQSWVCSRIWEGSTMHYSLLACSFTLDSNILSSFPHLSVSFIKLSKSNKKIRQNLLKKHSKTDVLLLMAVRKKDQAKRLNRK